MDAPRHPRHRAVAGVDVLIAQAEQLRVAQAVVLQGLIAAGLNTRRAAMLLQITERRLEQLQASRQALVAGEFATELRRHDRASPDVKAAGCSSPAAAPPLAATDPDTISIHR